MFKLNQQVKYFIPSTQEYEYGKIIGPSQQKDKLAVDVTNPSDTEQQIVYVPIASLIPADGETPTVPTYKPKTGPFKMSDFQKKSLL